jgi:hypothetical protein
MSYLYSTFLLNILNTAQYDTPQETKKCWYCTVFPEMPVFFLANHQFQFPENTQKFIMCMGRCAVSLYIELYCYCKAL